MNQRGIAAVLILITLAVVIGAGAVAYGYFILGKSSQTTQTGIPVMNSGSTQTKVQVGSPECPELDYTGCDTSGNFMTWTDDGVR